MKNDGTNNVVAKRREMGNKETKKGRVIIIGIVIIIIIIIEIFIQNNPSIQEYCYQRGPTD